MLKKIKCTLLLLCILVSRIFAYSLTGSVDIYQKNNTAILYYNLEDTSNSLVFESNKEAANFVNYLTNFCDDLNHMDRNMIIHPDKERLEYVYSTTLIRRIKYVINYANPLIQYPNTPKNLKENYYNKQYYKKSIATGENTSLNVSGNIKELLKTIIYEGLFNDDLLNKYNVPIPSNYGRRRELGCNFVLKGKN